MSINIKGVCVRVVWVCTATIEFKKKKKKHKIQSFELLKVSNLLNLFNF